MDQNAIPMDPATITAALGALRATFAAIGEFRKLLNDGKVKTQQVNDLILQIQNSLLHAQEGLLQSQVQVADLTAEINTFKRQLANLQEVRENYEFRDNMCWRKGTGEGPFCPTCLQGDHKAVNLLDCSGHYECRVHKQNYLTAAQWKEADRAAGVC
jgi:hypothetical protein